jgi:hypothetical protein
VRIIYRAHFRPSPLFGSSWFVKQLVKARPISAIRLRTSAGAGYHFFARDFLFAIAARGGAISIKHASFLQIHWFDIRSVFDRRAPLQGELDRPGLATPAGDIQTNEERAVFPASRNLVPLSGEIFRSFVVYLQNRSLGSQRKSKRELCFLTKIFMRRSPAA